MRNATRISEGTEEYLAHLKAKGLELGTVKTHAQPLRKALTLWGDMYVHNVRPEHVDLFFNTFDYMPKTRNLYLGNLRLFFAYGRRHNWIPKDYDPTEGWRMLKVPRKEMPRIGVEQFVPLLQAAQDPRDRAVVALGLFTFCRASEIQTLRVRDLDFKANTVQIFRWKTKEADTMPLVSELKTEMLRWFRQYESEAGGLNPDWYLCPARGPLPMGHNHALGRLAPTGESAPIRPEFRMSHPYRAVQRPLRAIGVTEKGTGGHVLRRSGARALFDRLRYEGYDGALMRVSSMLGHSSTKITEHYLSLGSERTQRNELLGGKPMFPDIVDAGEVVNLRAM